MSQTILRILRRRLSPASPTRGDGLVMSATLQPPREAVARANPAERLGDYLDALRFYLSLPDETIDRILLVDNSAGDLSPLLELAESLPHNKDVEFISFAGNDHSPRLGKAYGEFRLLDHGLANNSLFSPDDVVWKTTGRLKFLNLDAMAARCRGTRFDVLCDLRNVPWVGSGKWRGHENMDLRVVAFRAGAYDAIFRGLWQAHAEDFDARFMYRILRDRAQTHRIVPRFPLQPRLQGISGRHQRDYQSAAQRRKDGLRGMARRLAPWLWL